MKGGMVGWDRKPAAVGEDRRARSRMDGGKTEVFCSTHMIRRSVTLPAAEAFRALKLCVSVSAQVSFRAEKLLLLMDASSVHYFDTLGCFCVPVRNLAFCILVV